MTTASRTFASSKPRVLYVVNEAYFFVSHRLPLAKAAIEAGYEVHLAAPEDHVWAPAGFSVNEIRDAGLIVHPLSLSRRGMNPIQELVTIANLFRLYRRLRPQLVHHVTPKPVLYGGILARLLGVPAMVSAYPGLGQIFVAKGVRAALFRRLVVLGYRIATAHANARIIVQNPEDAATLIRLGAVAAARVVLIAGAGVSLTEFTPGLEVDGPPLVILPARMIWEKGVSTFVEAARRLCERGVEARFALVGNTHPSNPSAVPEGQLKAWSEQGVVEWWGRRDDMPQVFKACHIVCLPSTYGEGIPKVLLEAAAAGRPIVATDIPGCREVVRPSVNGMLVPSGDVEGLADALARLIADRNLRQRMGRESRAHAEAKFSDREVVRQTLDIYQALAPSTAV